MDGLRNTAIGMEPTGNVKLVGYREDIHGNPPQDAAARQCSSICMWIARKKVGQFLAVGKVIDVLRLFPGYVDSGAWMVVESGPFQILRVKNLEGNTLLDHVDDESMGVTIPAFSLYLEEGEGVPNEDPPADIPCRPK